MLRKRLLVIFMLCILMVSAVPVNVFAIENNNIVFTHNGVKNTEQLESVVLTENQELVKPRNVGTKVVKKAIRWALRHTDDCSKVCG